MSKDKAVDSFPERCDGIRNSESLTGNTMNMMGSAQVSLKSVLQFRAELFGVLILLVLFIITGVAVTPGASG
jgi:hypothetical protein